MPNKLNRIEATSGPKTRKASTAVRHLQVAALAVVLVPLGSVAAEATPVSFTFSSTQPTGVYTFPDIVEGDAFDFTLTFTGIPIDDSFSVAVDAVAYSALDQLAEPAPAGSVCVPIAGPGQCVDFTAMTSAVKPTDFSNYTVTIAWTFDTNMDFPNTGGDQVQLLESHESGPFLNITVPGSYYSCDELLPCDPGISGQSDSFSEYTVVDTTPEPATCALFGSGLTGLLMQYRRRKRRP